MRKMKRLITLLMTVVMMMAMSITAFAGEASAPQIKINGVGTNEAKFTYVQVIEPDRKSTYGWKLTENAASFRAAIIEVLKVTKEDPTDAELIEAYRKDASESQKLAIINKVEPSNEMANPQTISSQGLYIVQPKANVDDPTKAKYKYNNIAVPYNFGGETALSVSVKKTPLKPDKSYTVGTDNVVEITKDVPYAIEFTVPFFAEDVQKAQTFAYGISDTITGGYIKADTLKVLEGTTELNANVTETKTGDKVTGLSIDLTALVLNGTLDSNDTVKITYTAVVTGTVVNNTAKFEYDHKPDDNSLIEVKSYTGDLKAFKYTVVDKKEVALDGAQFVILKYVDEVDPEDETKTVEVPYYAVLDSNNVLLRWDPAKTAGTPLTTGKDGYTPVAYGFDKDVTYYFQEIVAPEGYSVNDTPADAKWNTLEEDETDADYHAEAKLADTKLISLPFTGGMGTTIFTILGVAIMAMAAALFFATKKSHN